MASGSISHLTESGIFIPLPARLDHKVGEPAVKDGVKGIDVNLVEAPCRFALSSKKVSASLGFRKMSAADPSQAMNWFFLTPIGNLIYFYINYKVEGNPFQFTLYQSEHWFHDTTYFANCLKEIIAYLTDPETSNTLIMCIWLPELLLFIITIALLAYGLIRHPLK